MKRILYIIIAALCITMVACGNRQAKSVADKINAGDSLTQEDYIVMADYVIDGYNKAAEVIANAPEDSTAKAAVKAGLQKTNEELEYQTLFFNTLKEYTKSKPDSVDSSLRDKIAEIKELNKKTRLAIDSIK